MNKQDETNQLAAQDQDQDAQGWSGSEEEIHFDHGNDQDQEGAEGVEETELQRTAPSQADLTADILLQEGLRRAEVLLQDAPEGRRRVSQPVPVETVRSVSTRHSEVSSNDAEERIGTPPKNVYNELEGTPSPDEVPIEFDDTSPLALPQRRSVDPILDQTDRARRLSNAVFNSPLPISSVARVPTNNVEQFTLPESNSGTQRVMAAAGGGGDPGPPSSSSSSASSNNTPAPSPVPPPRIRRPRHVDTPSTADHMSQEVQVVRVQGRALRLRTSPLGFTKDHLNRIWNKYERHLLPTEDRLAFDARVASYVLAKNNKLRQQSSVVEDDEALQKNYNLRNQIRAIKKHCDEYDISDVFTILVPHDVMNSSTLQNDRYDLFEDYMVLDPDLVAQSNVYYNRYCADKFVSENLALSYNMLKSNTDEILFQKCLEDYDRYHPFQQGGPLMFSLILKKISSGTEQQLDYLKSKAEKIRISSLEGENVDKAISLLDAALNTFKSASTKTLNRKPIEWEKNLVSIFQTSSNSTFNQLFRKLQNDVRQDADMSGGQPQWPSHERIIRLASATYNRLKLSGDWDAPSRKKALIMQPQRQLYQQQPFENKQQSRPYTPNENRSPPICWNCNKEGHTVTNCTQEIDQNKVNKARDEYRARRRNNGSISRRRRANIARKKRDAKDSAIAPEQRMGAPQANLAAEPINPYGYTNRNLEATLRNL